MSKCNDRIKLLEEMLRMARPRLYILTSKYQEDIALGATEKGYLCALDVVAEWQSLVDGDLGNGPSNVFPLGEDSIL